jgi:acyl-CoA reductase-like NAD-dependent aldehyde dehydrogenase
MRDMTQFYINGEWIDPVTPNLMNVYNPATDEVCGKISMGGAADVDKAVIAANKAFASFSLTSKEERLELLQSILKILVRRNEEIAHAIMEEMGAPWDLALNAQAESGPQQFAAIIEVLKNYAFEEMVGTSVGVALSGHPGIAMISFTGSTKAGISVAQNAAPSVKRVTQELGGKSANIILSDADFSKAVAGGARSCFSNSGQSCNAPTRMLVPIEKLDEAAEIAGKVAQTTITGKPNDDDTIIGPVVSKTQWLKIQDLIKVGIDEGANLIAGGLGKPNPSSAGYFVKPTVFSNVNNSMRIAREEIFGPVLSIIPYNSEEDAIAIANDTPYGLAGFVSSGNIKHAREVASKMRTGMVHINGAPLDSMAPFGGYKQSGNGREWGEYGMDEFLEIKSMYGFEPK